MKNIKELIFLLPALWLFTGFYTYRESPVGLVIITIVFLIFTIPIIKFSQIKEQVINRKFTWILWFASLFAILSKEIHGYGNNEIRVLISLAIYASIVPENTMVFLRKYLSILIAISCFIAFLYSFHQTYILGLSRVWGINPIPYTTFSAGATITSVYFILNDDRLKYKVMHLLASTAGIASIFISQTRGSLLSLTIAFIILIVLMLNRKRNLKYPLIMLFSIVVMLGLINFSKIESRVAQTKIEINEISSGNLNTSIGYRFQVWQAGYEILKSPSIIGLGKGYLDANKELYKQNKISKSAVYWDHYHNQYINSFVKHGAIGLLILLCFILIPILYFFKNKNDDLAIVGLSVSIVYAISSLTDIPFNQAISLGFYLILVFIITYPHSQHND